MYLVLLTFYPEKKYGENSSHAAWPYERIFDEIFPLIGLLTWPLLTPFNSNLTIYFKINNYIVGRIPVGIESLTTLAGFRVIVGNFNHLTPAQTQNWSHKQKVSNKYQERYVTNFDPIFCRVTPQFIDFSTLNTMVKSELRYLIPLSVS